MKGVLKPGAGSKVRKIFARRPLVQRASERPHVTLQRQTSEIRRNEFTDIGKIV